MYCSHELTKNIMTFLCIRFKTHQSVFEWRMFLASQGIAPGKPTKAPLVRGFAKKKNSKNPRLLWKWVGGSRIFFFFGENGPKIALNQYWYFGVVYHVYSVCTYIAKSCWLLWFECSVHVSDGFPKKKVWMVGGVNSILFFWKKI